MSIAFNAENIKKDIESMLNINFPYEFEYVAADGVYACLKNGKAVIGGEEKTDFYRALMLFALNVKKGNNDFEISQKRHFEKLGAFLDVARNGVLKVEKIKEIINLMALLGFNSMHLYLEDEFELPGYPHFGYRRGRYTHDELKEIDDYAFEKGIEVVPNIEVLGHLEQYLRYAEGDEFKESDSVLKCGEEKTYAFIEAMVKTMRKCFRSKYIVTLCDEAGTVGIPEILKKKEYISTYDIALKHISKVADICKKYGFETVELTGDFFYHHLGKGYYDFEFSPDKKEIEKIPDVKINYWDYYHTDYSDYVTLLEGHRALGKDIVFLGGMWMWCGQLPNIDFTFNTMEPALKCCLEYGVKQVTAATFGDDGNETNIAFVLPTLLIFSENCFHGRKYTSDLVYELSQELLNLDMNKLRALSDYHYPWCKNLTRDAYIWPVYMGKRIFYADILYNQADTYEFAEILEKHKKALAEIANYGKDTPYAEYFDYARCIFEITTKKMEVLSKIREAYKSKDQSWLEATCSETIPSLISKYRRLMMLHEKQWLNSFKPFGWEELNIRYGGIIERLEYAKRRLTDYASGNINSVPELEYDFIENVSGKYNAGGCYWYQHLKSCGL